MVGWEDVEEDTRATEERGGSVELVQFEGSKHVGHIILDQKRYWSAVKSVLAVK